MICHMSAFFITRWSDAQMMSWFSVIVRGGFFGSKPLPLWKIPKFARVICEKNSKAQPKFFIKFRN